MTNHTIMIATPGMPFLDVLHEDEGQVTAVSRVRTVPESVARWAGQREMQMEIITFDATTGGR